MLASFLALLVSPCFAASPLPSTSTRTVEANITEAYRLIKAESIRHGRPVETNVVFSSSVRVDGDTTFNDSVSAPASTITASSFVSVCPSGFTSVESGGRQLGCIETAEHGTDTWIAASTTCFSTFGAMLPNETEWYIAAFNFTLSDETDDWEWGSAGVVDKDGTSDFYTTHGMTNLYATSYAQWDSAIAYRCWIPK